MRRLPLLVAWLITAGATVPAVAQLPPKVTVSRWAYVYVTPHVRLEPLAQIEPGVELPVLGAEGDWYLIQYTSPRWGKRRGYIHRSNVQTVKDRPKGGTQSSAAATTPPRPPAVVASPTVPPAASTPISPDEAAAGRRLELEAAAAAIAAFRIAPGTSRKIMIFGGRGGHRTVPRLSQLPLVRARLNLQCGRRVRPLCVTCGRQSVLPRRLRRVRLLRSFR